MSPSDGLEISVPVRVVANDAGCEVTFTLFREPDMSIGQHSQDMRLVEQDLQSLKSVMER